jgi:hypothetical protein
LNILLCLSHSIEEYDQVRLLSELGYDVFSIGGYIDPAHPHDPKRPALPDVPFYPDLKAAVDGLGTADNLGYAQTHLPDALIDWADTIIYHHNLHRLWGQWDRVSHKRVIWRTVGQSVENNEREAAPYRAKGLQIVRYSPKERNIPGYAGTDALIRFYKDPDDFWGWTGDDPVVIQFVQSFGARRLWCNRDFFEAATDGLPRMVYGPDSEELDYGGGTLSYDAMRARLRSARAYLYTGTQPASYTLGLIEAMMTGIPVVSITPRYMTIFPYGPDLFEGHEIAGSYGDTGFDRTPEQIVVNTRGRLSDLLTFEGAAQSASEYARARAIALFGRDTIAAQWKAFLG